MQFLDAWTIPDGFDKERVATDGSQRTSLVMSEIVGRGRGECIYAEEIDFFEHETSVLHPFPNACDAKPWSSGTSSSFPCRGGFLLARDRRNSPGERIGVRSLPHGFPNGSFFGMEIT